MFIINALASKESVHFVAIDFAVTVEVNGCEFLPQTLLFSHFVRRHLSVKLLLVVVAHLLLIPTLHHLSLYLI